MATREGYSQTEGFSDTDCINVFKTWRNQLRDKFIAIMENEPKIVTMMPILRNATYGKYPRLDTNEFQHWLAYLVANNLIPQPLLKDL